MDRNPFNGIPSNADLELSVVSTAAGTFSIQVKNKVGENVAGSFVLPVFASDSTGIYTDSSTASAAFTQDTAVTSGALVHEIVTKRSAVVQTDRSGKAGVKTGTGQYVTVVGINNEPHLVQVLSA